MTSSSPNLLRENVPLAPLSYYKIGGPARWYAQPTGLEDLRILAQWLKIHDVPLFILGAGSNLLISDRGFSGLVLHTNRLQKELHVEDRQTAKVYCGASIQVSQLLRFGTQEGIGGWEGLAGIPGTMGGVVVMNGGTKISELKDHILRVSAYCLKSERLVSYDGPALSFSYRAQHFLSPTEVVVDLVLQGIALPPDEAKRRVDEVLKKRHNTQPYHLPSCGSVFKNPDPQRGVLAWSLIDQAGLRGHRIGNAQISEIHSNFIVNLGGASSQDVLDLIQLIQTEVKNRFGVLLEEEVILLDESSGVICSKN